jgi:hypothetical protein
VPPGCQRRELPQNERSFAFSVPFRASAQKLLLKRTPAGTRILSTTSVTLFEVHLSMIVQPAAQVPRQSSAGMASRAAANTSAASNAGCICVGCFVGRPLVGLLASILSHLLAAGLAARHSQVCPGRLLTPAGRRVSSVCKSSITRNLRTNYKKKSDRKKNSTRVFLQKKILHETQCTRRWVRVPCRHSGYSMRRAIVDFR